MTSAGCPLSVRSVVKHFGGVRAVDGASFDVAGASLTALIGPNGAGKSTLFNVMTGFERAQQGDVLLDGRSIFGRPPHVIARDGMVRTFQLTKALAGMTVLENMLLAAPDNPGESLWGILRRPRAWRRRERELRETALALLQRFDLREKASDYAGTLSGGQRKLLELARALMLEPRVLLLDEPLAGVNPALARRILAHIERLRSEQRATILFIEHDHEAVMRHADRVVVMAEGRVVAVGEPDEIRADERVIEAYLGSGRRREPGEEGLSDA